MTYSPKSWKLWHNISSSFRCSGERQSRYRRGPIKTCHCPSLLNAMSPAKPCLDAISYVLHWVLQAPPPTGHSPLMCCAAIARSCHNPELSSGAAGATLRSFKVDDDSSYESTSSSSTTTFWRLLAIILASCLNVLTTESTVSHQRQRKEGIDRGKRGHQPDICGNARWLSNNFYFLNKEVGVW